MFERFRRPREHFEVVGQEPAGPLPGLDWLHAPTPQAARRRRRRRILRGVRQVLVVGLLLTVTVGIGWYVKRSYAHLPCPICQGEEPTRVSEYRVKGRNLLMERVEETLTCAGCEGRGEVSEARLEELSSDEAPPDPLDWLLDQLPD